MQLSSEAVEDPIKLAERVLIFSFFPFYVHYHLVLNQRQKQKQSIASTVDRDTPNSKSAIDGKEHIV